MKRKVESGKTLLVDGPASVILISGEAEVFSYRLKNARRIVIREGKRLPFMVQRTAEFDISEGENAQVEEVDGNTIPPSWIEAHEKLNNLQHKPVTIIVLGAVDSGKTSFCTFLINKLLNEKRKVAILDGDMGQSDVGPPCTIAYVFVAKQVTDPFNLREDNAFFVGFTSPSNAVDKVIEGLTFMKGEILAEDPDFVVINTDGWVEGEDAVRYKGVLVEQLSPDMVFCIQQKDEMTPLLNTLDKFRIVSIDSPVAIRQRSIERRRNLRELGYAKYLRNSRVQSFPLNWLKIEGDRPLGLNMTGKNVTRAGKIYELLGENLLRLIELADRVYIVVDKKHWIDPDIIRKIEKFVGKKVSIVRKGKEKGLLTALYDNETKFLGIGVLHEIDYRRRVMKVYTPVSENVSKVVIGSVKLDKNHKEIPSFAEEQMDFAMLRNLF